MTTMTDIGRKMLQASEGRYMTLHVAYLLSPTVRLAVDAARDEEERKHKERALQGSGRRA